MIYSYVVASPKHIQTLRVECGSVNFSRYPAVEIPPNTMSPSESEQIVAELIDDLAAGLPPTNLEHDIAYNYLVHQGCVTAEGILAFPELMQILREQNPDPQTRGSITFLCAEIFPATNRSEDDRENLLSEIQKQMPLCKNRRERINWLSAFARVAANDDLLAEALLSLAEQTCPNCGNETNRNWLGT